MTTPYKILIVDDEVDILDFMEYNLKKEGYETETAENGKIALQKLEHFNPHLILLDMMMPELNGIETCRAIRRIPKFKNTIISFLTARSEDQSEIAGFDVGADDYITKPIKPRVLLSRIKALLRRFNQEMSESKITVGELEIDREKYEITHKGKVLVFPKKEFELLSLLASKPGKVFSRKEILNRIWGNDIIVGDRTIDVHIRKLREKLRDDYFKTIKGIGYKFDL